jgi:hypothetical protein
MLTAQQICWAASHDWFIRDNGDGTITVNDAWTQDGVLHQQTVRHTGSFKALRDWAGY